MPFAATGSFAASIRERGVMDRRGERRPPLFGLLGLRGLTHRGEGAVSRSMLKERLQFPHRHHERSIPGVVRTRSGCSKASARNIFKMFLDIGADRVQPRDRSFPAWFPGGAIMKAICQGFGLDWDRPLRGLVMGGAVHAPTWQYFPDGVAVIRPHPGRIPWQERSAPSRVGRRSFAERHFSENMRNTRNFSV